MTDPPTRPDEFLPDLCDAIAADSAAIAKRIASEIRSAQPNYYGRVGPAEHEEMVRQQVLAVLDGLARRGLPSSAHVNQARLLGGRRAEQGLPVEAVIGAYHVGCRELWSALLVHTRA